MRDLTSLRERYLRDPLPVRVGGVAANLARLSDWADHTGHRDVLRRVVEESEFFIEWTAAGAALDLQVLLVDVQRQLARWQYRWVQIWNDPQQRKVVAEQAAAWSERLLAMSGLLSAPAS